MTTTPDKEKPGCLGKPGESANPATTGRVQQTLPQWQQEAKRNTSGSRDAAVIVRPATCNAYWGNT